MAISPTAMSPTQFGGFAAPGVGTSSSPGLPALNLPGITTQQATPGQISTSKTGQIPNEILQLLSQPPTSMTQTIGPLLQQIYGMQGNMMEPLFAQQGAQGAAQAQSDAMQRGITGSSIEESGIQQAYGQANQGFAQYMAQQLGQLAPEYMSAAGTDISNQTNYKDSLAQAMGQTYTSKVQQQQFAQQLSAMQAAQSSANNTALLGAGISAFGDIAGLSAQGALMSDVRLKEDLEKVGSWHGLGVYKFRYKKHTGFDLPTGPQVGLLAHEVAKKFPEAVRVIKGFLSVNYGMLAEAA